MCTCLYACVFIDISPVSLLFSLSHWAARTTHICLSARRTNCRLQSNISQILLLYKTCGYHNKFDSLKSLGVCYWYVKIQQSGYTGHGLALFMFYVQKIWHLLGSVVGFPLASDKLLGAPAFMRPAYRMCIYSVESLLSSNRIWKMTKTTRWVFCSFRWYSKNTLSMMFNTIFAFRSVLNNGE